MFESAFSVISAFLCLGLLGSLLVLFFQYRKQKIKMADALRRARAAKRRYDRLMQDKREAEEDGRRARDKLAEMMTDVAENELRAQRLDKENGELKDLRDSLARKNKEMATILGSMPGGFALMECGGRFSFQYVREELPRLLGYTVPEFLRESRGNALGAITEEDRTDGARRMRDALDRGEEGFTVRYYMNCKDGGKKLLSMNARVMQDESGARMLYAFYIDVTKEQETTDLIAMQQKIVEEERENKVLLQEVLNKERRYKLKLEEALLNAEKANEAKSRFLNSMSHDIRTPLNAILGFATLARKDPSDGGKVDYALDKIELSGKHLLSLINDVLDMSKIESGAVTLVPETHSLKQIMEELDIMIRHEAEKHELKLAIEADVTHDLVAVDVLRINQILLNIGSNAIKYTQPGGSVTIRVTEDTAHEADGLAHLTFSCRDTGIGMDEEFVEHVFDAFSREQTTTISGIQGTGLGMAITKRLVEMMGGTITARSEKGAGSEFIVSLQLPIVEEENAPDGEKNDAYDLSDVSVLLVEDNELNREIAEEFLKDAGLTVDTAEDGLVAVEKMKRAKPGDYDLILMDIQMPNMDGYEASTAIRAMEDPAIANIPIIAMTANAFSEDREKALKCGMNGHVPKPIDTERLYSTIQSVVRRIAE